MVTTMEPTKGNLQLLHPFSLKPLHNVPQFLDLGQFRPSRLDSGFHIDWNNDPSFPKFDKLVLSANRRIPPVQDCGLLALKDGGQLSGLPSIGSVSEQGVAVATWARVSESGYLHNFDDVLTCKGKHCALDRQGRLYSISSRSFKVNRTLIPYSIFKRWGKGWRKRLVRSSLDGNLYMVVRRDDEQVRNAQPRLRVYKQSTHCRNGKSWVWERVNGFGDQVLFVSRKHCFFVAAEWFPTCKLSSCIVFSNDAFPRYTSTGWELPLPEQDRGGEQWKNAMVFRLGYHYNNLLSISSFPNFPTMLWSPPSWAFKAPTLPSGPFQSQSMSETEKNEEMQFDSNNHYGPFLEVVSALVVGPELQEQTTEVPSTMNNVEHVAEEASDPETPREIMHSVTSAYITSVTEKSSKTDSSMVKFEGFDVSSSLVPTLQNIWSKRGNIVENCIIRNGDLVAKALESLARAVLILKDNSAESLDDDQADYLSATLADLRCMCFEVEWLAPSVEKAVALVKSKPFVRQLEDLRQSKAKADEMRSKLADEMAKLHGVVKELEQGIVKASIMIPFSGKVDLAEILGEELP